MLAAVQFNCSRTTKNEHRLAKFITMIAKQYSYFTFQSAFYSFIPLEMSVNSFEYIRC